MNDVFRHVMFAPGDEDLGAGDLVGTVGLLFSFRPQCPHIGAGLGFREVHGAGPLTRDELFQIGRFLLFRAMSRQRFDGAAR